MKSLTHRWPPSGGSRVAVRAREHMWREVVRGGIRGSQSRLVKQEKQLLSAAEVGLAGCAQ